MSRKIINLDFSKCASLKGTLLERAECLDLCEKVVPTKEGLCSTKNYIITLVNDSIEKYRVYTKELHGDQDLMTSEELSAINYLRKMIK